MRKDRTIYVSTSRHHEKATALTILRAQIQQRTLEKTSDTTSTTNSAVSTTPITTSVPIANTISNLLHEAPTFYTIDGVELFDNEGVRWGEIINEIPVGDDSTLTGIQINAVLTRVDDSTFTLPTHAEYVTDVWFDHLKAEPTNHYIFFPESLITTTSALGSQVVVSAFYLNKTEVI